MIIRKEVVIALVENAEHAEVGIEIFVPSGMTTLEVIGLLEVAKIQHLDSKHTQGPTSYGPAPE